MSRHPGPPFTVFDQFTWYLHLDAKLDLILKELHHMSTTAVTREQLNAGIDALTTTIHEERAAVTQAINDAIAKAQSGQVSTPEDFTAELQKILSAQQEAAQTTADVTALDPGQPTIPVSTTPAPVSTDPTEAAPAGDSAAASQSSNGETDSATSSDTSAAADTTASVSGSTSS